MCSYKRICAVENPIFGNQVCWQSTHAWYSAQNTAAFGAEGKNVKIALTIITHLLCIPLAVALSSKKGPALSLGSSRIRPHTRTLTRVAVRRPSITEMGLYSLTDVAEMEGWVGVVGWPIADSLPTQWSPVNHKSGVAQGKSSGKRSTDQRRQPEGPGKRFCISKNSFNASQCLSPNVGAKCQTCCSGRSRWRGCSGLSWRGSGRRCRSGWWWNGAGRSCDGGRHCWRRGHCKTYSRPKPSK